jgi:hypothetical protein
LIDGSGLLPMVIFPAIDLNGSSGNRVGDFGAF